MGASNLVLAGETAVEKYQRVLFYWKIIKLIRDINKINEKVKILIMGLPGSGKTFLAKDFLNLLMQNG